MRVDDKNGRVVTLGFVKKLCIALRAGADGGRQTNVAMRSQAARHVLGIGHTYHHARKAMVHSYRVG
jgi:hypothetical protein